MFFRYSCRHCVSGDDIAPLVKHFVQLHGGNNRIDPEALQVFENHAWPGNVRELQNVIRRTCIMAGGDPIEIGHLPPDLIMAVGLEFNKQPEVTVEAPVSEIGEVKTVTVVEERQIEMTLQECIQRDLPTLNTLESIAITTVLAHTNDDRGQTAQILGIDRTTLYRKLKRMEISEGSRFTNSARTCFSPY